MGTTQDHVPRNAQIAVDDVTCVLLEILAEAGVNINQPNTPEGRRQFMAELKDKKIEFRKTIAADNPAMSGTQVLKGGVVIGFVPAVVADGLIV